MEEYAFWHVAKNGRRGFDNAEHFGNEARRVLKSFSMYFLVIN